MAAAELITQAEYAKRRGCSAVAVHKAVKAGRISLIEGRIDPAVADVQWQRNTRARVGSRSADDASSSAGGSGTGGDGRPDRAGDDDGAYWQSRARREAAEADLAELKLKEQLGDLVRASDVRASFARKASALRESLLQVPARLAAVLAAESDQARCHDLLAAELRTVLEQLTAEAA